MILKGGKGHLFARSFGGNLADITDYATKEKGCPRMNTRVEFGDGFIGPFDNFSQGISQGMLGQK